MSSRFKIIDEEMYISTIDEYSRSSLGALVIDTYFRLNNHEQCMYSLLISTIHELYYPIFTYFRKSWVENQAHTFFVLRDFPEDDKWSGRETNK